jgi:hypothetical protein
MKDTNKTNKQDKSDKKKLKEQKLAMALKLNLQRRKEDCEQS